MLVLISLLSFMLILLAAYTFYSHENASREPLRRRIREIASSEEVSEEEVEKSFNEKLMDSLSEVLEKGMQRNTKAHRQEKLQHTLDQAGLSKETTPVRYISGLIVFSSLLALITGIIAFVITQDPGRTLILMVLVLGLYLYLQRFLMTRRMTLRKQQMIRDLPYTLDLILVSVEAGLSFDGALAKVVANIPGPISEEFGKTLKEIRMGIHRKTAMKNMSIRCDIKELSALNTSIIQADELGVSLSKIIRIQASTLREDRKQKAREKAMKAPVKILIPLIIFVFPTIFIVILGPSVLKIMEIFK